MSIFSEIQSAALEAQNNLAEQGGAQPGKKNATYNGAAITGVWGTAQVEQDMVPAGGYRGRTVTTFSATRGQFAAPPVTKGKIYRTDVPTIVSPQIAWVIDWIDYTDAYFYRMSLIHTGE